MNKEKIFIFTSVHNWDDVRIFQKQAKSLAKEYSVDLYATGDFDYKEVDNVRIHGLKKYKKRYLRPLNWIKILYSALKSDAKVFHFHDPELLPIGYLIKIFKRKAVIYDSHENVRLTILNRTWIKEGIRKPISKYFNKIEKFIGRKIDLTITVLDEIAEEFIESGVNTCVIKNFQLDTGESKLEIMNKDIINIVYAGGLSELRGSLELVNAFNYIKNENIRLDLIGSFSSEAIEKSVMDMVDKDSRINYRGIVSYNEAQKILKTSDIGVVTYKPGPNHDFCLPNKIFEYMSVGVPIIATKIPYWYDNFNKYDCILFVDEVESKQIAKAIEYLADNKERSKEMGQIGYKAFKENFTWQSQEEKLLEQYKILINKKK